MIIRIRVSALSKKILLRDHPDPGSPIRVTRRNVLYPLLQANKKDKSSDLMTELVQFDVPAPPKHYENAGENIHRFHLSKLEAYIFAQFRLSSEAKTSIKSFYDYYGLDDDDYDMDSAYRRWQRFLHEKKTVHKEKTAKNFKSFVVQNSPKIPASELELIVANFSLHNFSKFIGTKKKVKVKMFRQMRVWVYYHIGGYEIAEIADLFELNLKNAYKSRSRFSYLVRVKKLFPFPALLPASYN